MSNLSRLLSQYDPRSAGQRFSQNAFRDAQILGQTELARLTREAERKKTEFNPMNALAGAATGFVASGGNPLGAALGAAGSARGQKFQPLSSGLSGAGMGAGSANMFTGSTDIGSAIGKLSEGQNVGKLGTLLTGIPETQGVGKSLATFGKLSEPKLTGTKQEYYVKTDDKGAKRVIDVLKDSTGQLISENGKRATRTLSDIINEGYLPSSVLNADLNHDIKMSLLANSQRTQARSDADRIQQPVAVKLADGTEYTATPKIDKPETKSLPATRADDMSQINDSLQMLDKLAASANNSKLWGAEAGLRKINPLRKYTDPEIVKKEQFIAAVKQVIGKGLEGGVLRKEDEIKYEKILPTVDDRQDVFNAKLDQVRKLLEDKFENRRIAYDESGYDVSNLSTQPVVRYSEQINIPSTDGVMDIEGYKVRVK